MTVSITIDCDNDAFQPDPAAEVSRILRELAKRVANESIQDGHRIPIRDVNGNRVGELVVEP